MECGTTDALDVHHPYGKEEPIKYQWAWARIKEEALVTILLCSGCHRKRHRAK